MKNGPIGTYRGAFDMPHMGQLDTIISSFRDLSLSKLYVIAKFIGKKDIATSSKQRIEMMNLQLEGLDLPIEVIRQNVVGHVAELADLRQKHDEPIINICGSDKGGEEINKYGNKGDIFGIVSRFGYEEELPLIYKTANEKDIKIIEIKPKFCTSSSQIRDLILQGKDCPDGLNKRVYDYISQYNLYSFRDNELLREEFFSEWQSLVKKLLPFFPELKLSEIQLPEFNPIQSREAWQEKFIRTILKMHVLKDDKLIELVSKIKSIY